MPRPARIPAALTRGPFTFADAELAGLKRWHLEGSAWRRIAPRTYVAAGLEPTEIMQLEAAWRRLPPKAVFSGLTAAWLHGCDVEPCEPIDVTVPRELGVTTRSGMVVRRVTLSKSEVVKRRGFQATSVTRTLLDISTRLTLTEAVVIADMALHLRLISSSDLNRSLSAYAGTSGIRALRDVTAHVEPATESPMETRMRMLLVLAGLPRPQAQVSIHDRWRRLLGRLDLYYPAARLGIEYDGGTHRNTLAEDNRRQNRLVDAGIRFLRFTAGDIYNTPDSVVALVRAHLG